MTKGYFEGYEDSFAYRMGFLNCRQVVCNAIVDTLLTGRESRGEVLDAVYKAMKFEDTE